MYIYDCRKIGDFNCCLMLRRCTDEYNVGDIYADEYKDANHHFVYGKYIVLEKWNDKACFST